jgi:hypothetical protein
MSLRAAVNGVLEDTERTNGALAAAMLGQANLILSMEILDALTPSGADRAAMILGQLRLDWAEGRVR